MSVLNYSCNGLFVDRMKYQKNGLSLTGVTSFAAAKTFLTGMQAYTNLALMRVVHTIKESERITGNTAGTGHFDLGGYVAKLSFYNYAAEDKNESPNIGLTLLGPKDSILQETKDGIWIVKDDIGNAMASALATALQLGTADVEYIKGEVPEN